MTAKRNQKAAAIFGVDKRNSPLRRKHMPVIGKYEALGKKFIEPN
jgi:hypothetical protein